MGWKLILSSNASMKKHLRHPDCSKYSSESAAPHDSTYISTAIPVTIWQAQHLHTLIPICLPSEDTSNCLFYTICTHNKQIVKSKGFLNELRVLVSTFLLFPLLSMCHVSQQQSSVVIGIPKNEKSNCVASENIILITWLFNIPRFQSSWAAWPWRGTFKMSGTTRSAT
jgi:hypothetical protein